MSLEDSLHRLGSTMGQLTVSSDWAWAWTAAFVGILTWIGLAIRRLFFHPLSKFPGPWYHSISELPVIVAMLSGRSFSYDTRLHERYGPVVRISPNELSFTSSSAIEDIYGWGKKKGVATTEKDPRFSIGVTKPEPPFGLIDAPKHAHGRLRRALTSIFTTSALLHQEPIIQASVDELMHALQREIDKKEHGVEAKVDMTLWSKCFAFDVLGSLVFGESFGCLASHGTQNVDCAEAISQTITMGTYDQVAARLLGTSWISRRLLRPIVLLVLAPSRFYRGRLLALLRILRAVKKRLADDDRDDHKDIVYHVRKMNEAKDLLQDGEMERNLGDFIFAGSETVSAAFTTFSYQIGIEEHRDAYVKLRDLIRSSFDSPQDIKWSRLREMTYLDGVYRESLRLILTSVHRLRVVPPGGTNIDGCFVPGGTSVAAADYAASHLEANFQDANAFRPERWTDPDTKDSLGASRPFSYGPRDCIGKGLADIEMKLVIAHLIWRFDFSVDGVEDTGDRKGHNWKWAKKNDWEHIKVVLGAENPPLWMTIRNRA